MSDFLVIDIFDIGLIKRKKFRIQTKNKACNVISCRILGSTLLDTGAKILNVKAGDVLYIPKGARYLQETDDEELVYVHFDVLGDRRMEIQQIIYQNPQYVIECFKKMLNVWAKKEKNYKYVCTGLFYELIAETGIMLPKGDSDLLAPALQYIKEHFSDIDFSLEDACKKSNISRSYFNRVFKERFRITPVVYINRLKVEKAKFLLSCKTYTHSEIAALCGFSNTKYFYMVFKNVTGTTTKEFHEQIKNTDFF